MNPVTCVREEEVVRLVLSRRWPECAGDDLTSHVAACELCSDVAAVASLLRSEREASLRDVHIPAAGQVWWRAALRSHAEAAEAARRPLIWLLGIAAACTVGIGAALVSLVGPSMYEAAAAVAALPRTLGPDVAPLIETVRSMLPLALGVVACLVLTPIVVYFALSDK